MFGAWPLAREDVLNFGAFRRSLSAIVGHIDKEQLWGVRRRGRGGGGIQNPRLRDSMTDEFMPGLVIERPSKARSLIPLQPNTLEKAAWLAKHVCTKSYRSAIGSFYGSMVAACQDASTPTVLNLFQLSLLFFVTSNYGILCGIVPPRVHAVKKVPLNRKELKGKNANDKNSENCAEEKQL